MDSMLYSVLVLCWSIQSVLCAGDSDYETFHLESSRLCRDKQKASIFIGPWKAAILNVGHKLDSDGTPSSHKMHKCKVIISTNKNFGLAAVIEDMKIRAKVNKVTNGFVCQGDYVKLSTSGTSLVSKIFSFIPGDLFKSKATEELCGLRKKRQLFTEVGSNANVLSTLAHELEVEFHQGQRNMYPVNNSFTIVITAFKHTEDQVFTEACREKYICTGNENYCIDPRYVCDGHYNCAFPSGGGDELRCKAKKVSHPIFSTTTTIITSLAGIVSVGLVICCLFTIIVKVRSRSASPSGTPVPPSGLSPISSAPQLQRQHTLPPYEAVVMSDASQSWKSSAPPSPEVGEFPPSYHMLYPEGPPKDLHTEATTTGEQTSTQAVAL